MPALLVSSRALAYITVTKDRNVRHRCKAPLGHVIRYAEHQKPAACSPLVLHEMEAPALITQNEHRCRRPLADSVHTNASPAARQPSSLVKPVGLLPAKHAIILAQQHGQTAMADSAKLAVGKLAELLTQTNKVGRECDDHARPFDLLRCHSMVVARSSHGAPDSRFAASVQHSNPPHFECEL